MRAAGAVAGIAALLAFATPAHALTDQQAYALALKVKNDATNVAYQRCLASTEEVRQRGFTFNIAALIEALTGGLSLNERKRVARGAFDLPATVRVTADAHVRACVTNLAPQIEQQLLRSSQAVPPPARAANALPNVIDLRFTYRRSASLDRRRFGDTVRLNLQEGGAVVSENLAPQSAQDGRPFFHHVYYPYPSARVTGVVAPSPLDSRLTADQTPSARFCLERPTPLPRQRVEYDDFECVEGGACKPSSRSTGWLRQCRAPSAWLRELSPFTPAHAQPAPRRRWVTPSLDTLAARAPDGVGWSYFKLRTDSFRWPEVRAVEVGLAVNGVAVEEDGLTPAERPAPNDPSAPFDYLFALQTLDFQGREGGCDRVSVTLTPRLADGTRGRRLSFDLMYAALRDQPPRTEQAGDARLQWSATVIRPVREWRHWAIVHSYAFAYRDEASRDQAVQRAEADRRWLDQAGLVYQGAPVRGVVRPPMTVRNGRAAYGLAVGLAQPTGQIRFTFSEGEARQLGDWLVAHRAGSPAAAQVIDPQRYTYQAPSGAVTPPGVCDRA